jgi:DNA polymerase III subunit alpha
MTNSFTSQFEELTLPAHGVRLPTIEIDAKIKTDLGLPENISNFDFLRALCREGLKKLKIEKNNPLYKQYVDRAKYELETLKELEFVDYALLVWDVINFCTVNDIPVGLGRGSAAGSLVLYLIGVTKIDPIKYDLYFERFISKTRAKKQIVDGVTYLDGSLMCDVDMDICYRGRQKVLEYVDTRFAGKTAKICTLTTLASKLLIKECGKIIEGLSEDEVKVASSSIESLFGKPEDIEDAYDNHEEFREWSLKYPEAYNIALRLRGLIKNKGIHASAVLLSYFPVKDTIPIELSSHKSDVSSYDMSQATITNLKLDLLGLKAATVISDTCKLLGIKMEDIDYNDPIIYQNLYELKCPHGIFQVEAGTVYKAIRKIKPKNLEELSGVIAVARPGAMQFIDPYSIFTNTGVYQSIHPFFDEILKSTGGLVLYQEQLLKMVNKIGFSLEEAEIVRRVVGKKKVKEMAEWEQKVKDKIASQKLDPAIGDVLWKVMDASKDYSFNKSHSICYAALAAIETYLKFKHPKEFFLSLLKMAKYEQNTAGQIAIIEQELYHFGMKLLPPHIIKSDLDFSLEGDNIRFGLTAIKGIKSVEKLAKFRNKYSNKFDIFRAAEEAGIDIGELSSLIQAGALEGFKQSRSRVVLEAHLWHILTDREKKLIPQYGEKFNYDLIEIFKHLKTVTDEKGKPVLKPSRIETIKKKYAPFQEIYIKNSRSEKFANWFYERKLLGYTYNVTLRDLYQKTFEERGYDKNLRYIRDFGQLREKQMVEFMAVVKDSWTGTSKKGTKYLKVEVGDETGMGTVMLFNANGQDRIEEVKKNNKNRLLKEENIIFVKGQRFGDAIFADVITVEDQVIYTKLSELTRAKKKEEKELTEVVKTV